jgi:hypothetical protein
MITKCHIYDGNELPSLNSVPLGIVCICINATIEQLWNFKENINIFIVTKKVYRALSWVVVFCLPKLALVCYNSFHWPSSVRS